ncbi:uncharacterized protein FIBRA_00897 [Fibroporia radiculosa]|uniref:Uncharacterized protein n=1 Tax=Fibroporia radiculosa TaxID=599839 RepID=J4GIW6_9APHY|nr:uncharacterized protein FIBRA_00897 [Fibroporia radiculosa]CCL98890.1 predicted protein [Fibroporia radiculosa]
MRYSVVVAVAMVVAAPTFVAAVPGIAKKLAMKGVDKFHKHKFTMHDLKTAADVSQTAAQVSNNVKTINDNLGRREAHLLGRDDVEMELHDQAKR